MGKHLLEVEKAWLLSQIGEYWQTNLPLRRLTFLTEGLIPDCDDDVMDEVPAGVYLTGIPNSFPASFNI